MKCPICEKDVELQKKQVGVDEQGAPIFHQYAVCRACKKQWDLDKQRARKAASAQKGGVPSAAQAAHPKEPAGGTVSAKPSQEPKTVKKPVSESMKPEALSGEQAGMKPSGQETLSERKAVKKTVAAAHVPDKKAEQKPAAAPVPDKKAEQKPAAASAPGKKADQKPLAAEAAAAEKSARKLIPAEAETEKKTGQKPAAANPSERTGGRKPALEEPEEAGKKLRRRPAPAKASPEGEASGKGSSEKPSLDREVSRGAAQEKAVHGKPSPERGAVQRKASQEKPPLDREASRKPASGVPSGRKPGDEKTQPGKPAARKERPSSADRHDQDSASGQPRRSVAKKSGSSSGEQRYGNIPPDRVRAKKEHAVRKGYEDMLSTDPNYKPPKKKRPASEDETEPAKRERPASVKQRPHTKIEEPEDDDVEDEEMEYEEVKGRFRLPRILIGILSIVAAGFFAYGGFFTGLDNIAAGGTASTGTVFIVYGICMLAAGLLLIILQNNNSILAFLLPMLAYFIGAAFTFLNRQGESRLLYCAVAGVVFGIVFLILGIISRNSGYDDSEDYEDPYGDDYE